MQKSFNYSIAHNDMKVLRNYTIKPLINPPQFRMVKVLWSSISVTYAESKNYSKSIQECLN